MFKNLIIYRILPTWQASLEAAEAGLEKTQFTPCGATQEHASGFVPPRGEANGAMLESIGGQWIAKFFTESKAIPKDVLDRKVAEKAQRIEQEVGRKPGKKERRDLKEEAKIDLLPMAFTKQASTWVWIDPKAHFLCIDTSSQSRADEISSVLTELWPGFGLSLLDTQTSPQAAMAHWLATQEPPPAFSIGRECELKSADESKATVRYGRHSLDIAEVQQHIEQGKLPTKLALTWNDRVLLQLTQGLQLKKIELPDVALEKQSADDSGFDADVAIATGELTKLIPDLVEALGGEGRSGMTKESTGDATSAPLSHPCSNEPDQLYDQAVALVLKERKASISYVQRHLRIGYNRAAQLLEDMEKAGIVSHMGADGARKVTA